MYIYIYIYTCAERRDRTPPAPAHKGFRGVGFRGAGFRGVGFGGVWKHTQEMFQQIMFSCMVCISLETCSCLVCVKLTSEM